MEGLTSIWKDRGVMVETKVKLVKVLVFPIVPERRLGQWGNMREGRSTLSSCGVREEYWEYRGWIDRQTYRSSRTSTRNGYWSHFGHVVRAWGMEDDVMFGRLNGARKRGRSRQIWLDTLKGYSSGATISNMSRDARYRAVWRGATTASWMRLDGTR